VQLTNQQKLDILNDSDKKVSTITAICDKYGVHRNTVGQWKKDSDKIRKEVEEEGRANKRRTFSDDGLRRVRHGIRAFYELNETLPKSLKLPRTRELLLV
jgi:transposase-like protein